MKRKIKFKITILALLNAKLWIYDDFRIIWCSFNTKKNKKLRRPLEFVHDHDESSQYPATLSIIRSTSDILDDDNRLCHHRLEEKTCIEYKREKRKQKRKYEWEQMSQSK